MQMSVLRSSERVEDVYTDVTDSAKAGTRIGKGFPRPPHGPVTQEDFRDQNCASDPSVTRTGVVGGSVIFLLRERQHAASTQVKALHAALILKTTYNPSESVQID